MRKKSFISVLIALAITVALSACGGAEPTTPEETSAAAVTNEAKETKAATTKADTARDDVTDESVYPEVTIQSYIDIEMVEIIELGTDNEELSPAMVETNKAIYDDVITRMERYEQLLSESENNEAYYIGGIDIWAYSITDENYIQIYNTVFEYPTYGTAGDLFGFVYDKKNDNYLSLGEFLSDNGTTEYDIMNEITDIAHEEYPDYYIGEISVKAFNLLKDPDGNYLTSYLFEMEINETADGDPFKGFYLYAPYDNDVMELNSEHLFFDPYSVDQYYPLLHCNEGWLEANSDLFGNPTGEIDPNYDEDYAILQGDYYYAGDTAASHFSFYGSPNVDAYYGSGSYETSYTLSRLPDVEVGEEEGGTHIMVSYEVFNADGDYTFLIRLVDEAPGSFELYDKDGYFYAEYININS
jgi:hypothetical protein